MCNNVLELACNPSTIFNVTELTADPTYDVTDKFPDWMKREIKRQERINKILRWYQDLHWGWKLGVGIALLIGAIGFTVATGGGGAGVISVLVQTAIGIGVGVGLYTVGSLLMGTFTWEGLANAALDAFLITSAMVFISSAVNYIKYLSRGKQLNTVGLKECTNQCFIAGTLVHCEDGLKKIEDIKVGDKVLAYNEETGEQGYKKVINLFRNESKDWVGVTVNDKEIVSTPGHKYYLPLTRQWVSAKDLKAGDTVLLSNGQYAKVQATRSIHYDTPQTTYNFEVEEFHTYYVETGVLVHNKCERAAMREAKMSENIPLSQKPDQIIMEKMVGADGRTYFAKTELFGNKFIRNDFGGHLFLDGTTIPKHYNAGNWAIKGTKMQFYSNGVHFWYS